MRLPPSFVLIVAIGCTSNDPPGLTYQGNEPGYGLPEGGEIHHDHITTLGMPAATEILVYQYETPPDTAISPLPIPDPASQFGDCLDERQGQTWPFTPIANATFVTLPKAELSGPGITTVLDLPANASAIDSMFGQQLGTSYGYDQIETPVPANAPTAAMSMPGGEYTLDIGEGDPINYFMPAAYAPPLGIGGAGTVMFPDNTNLEMTWTAPANDSTDTATAYTNYTFFYDETNATYTPLFMCLDDVDGHQLIPAAVISALPATGLIVQANIAQFMDARSSTGAIADMRRFDLIRTFTNVSLYAKR